MTSSVVPDDEPPVENRGVDGADTDDTDTRDPVGARGGDGRVDAATAAADDPTDDDYHDVEVVELDVDELLATSAYQPVESPEPPAATPLASAGAVAVAVPVGEPTTTEWQAVAASAAATTTSAAAVAAAGGDAMVAAPTRSQVRAARRLQARKVGRLVRHIDLWSLLKVSLLFYSCMLVVGAIAGTLLWSALHRVGAVGSIEGFFEEIFLLDDFRFDGGAIFRVGVLGGMVGVVVLSLLTVVAGLLFNLISDLTGGIRLSVVELETARPATRRRSG